MSDWQLTQPTIAGWYWFGFNGNPNDFHGYLFVIVDQDDLKDRSFVVAENGMMIPAEEVERWKVSNSPKEPLTLPLKQV